MVFLKVYIKSLVLTKKSWIRRNNAFSVNFGCSACAYLSSTCLLVVAFRGYAAVSVSTSTVGPRSGFDTIMADIHPAITLGRAAHAIAPASRLYLG